MGKCEKEDAQIEMPFITRDGAAGGGGSWISRTLSSEGKSRLEILEGRSGGAEMYYLEAYSTCFQALFHAF